MTKFRNLIGARLALALQGNLVELRPRRGPDPGRVRLILALIAVVVVVSSPPSAARSRASSRTFRRASSRSPPRR